MSNSYLGRLSGELREQAKAFRKAPTRPEQMLWRELRNRNLDGHKFRRQVVIDRFIVDFCCLEKKLVVEVDGEIHDVQKEADLARTEMLVAMGFHVIRFSNARVLGDLAQVTREIAQICVSRPLPFAGEG